MTLDNMTIGEAKEIAALFSAGKSENHTHGAIGKKCIVLTYASGVHFGEVLSVSDNGGNSRCVIKNSRRLWRWEAKNGISLSDLAQGIDLSASKICAPIAEHYIEDAIEFIPVASGVDCDIENAKTYNA